MAQIKKKVKILEKKQPKKSTWWLWLLLAIVAVVAVVLVSKNWSSNGDNEIVAGQIEQATTIVNEIASEIQNSTVNLQEAQAKIKDAQKAVDEAKAIATMDEEKRAVAEVQAKLDKVVKDVADAKNNAESTQPSATDETGTPTKEEAGKQLATTPSQPAQSTGGNLEETSNQNEQSATTNSASSTNPSSTLLQGTLEQKAIQVIRGNYGNGAERKNALGNEYTIIQSRVNEMYRNGEVK